MSKSKRKSLTDAIHSLGISQAFQLKNPNGIGLTPPKETIEKNENAQNELTHPEQSPAESTRTERSQNKSIQAEPSQVEPTQRGNSQIEKGKTKHSQTEQSKTVIAQNENTRPELTQSKKPRNKNAQSELTQNQQAQHKSAHTGNAPVDSSSAGEAIALDGYFKMPHSVFADDQLRKYPADTFRLYLWFCSRAWRFKDSDGTIRASRTYIELCTGMSIATISRSLSNLRAGGFISLREHNHKIGNLWHVQCERPWDVDPGVCSKCACSRIKLRKQCGQFEHEAASN